jgi:hypothetical protein
MARAITRPTKAAAITITAHDDDLYLIGNPSNSTSFAIIVKMAAPARR